MQAEKMDGLFSGLRRAYGTYRITGKEKTKVQGRAVTLQSELTLEQWQAHIDGNTGIGVVPITDDNTVQFAALDIDIYDLDLNALEDKVISRGLPLVLCRTKSGGAHLYLFLAEPLPARHIRQVLTTWAVVLGFPGIEVFPKQDRLASKDDVGNWINMPYFDAGRTTRYAIANGKALTLDAFIEHARRMSITGEQLDDIRTHSDEDILPGGPPCLRSLAINGVPEGSRNNAMYNYGVLAKLMNEEDWHDQVLAFNTQFMDPPLRLNEVQGIIKSLSRKKYFYKCGEPPIVSLCDKALCRTCEFGINTPDERDDPGVQIEGLTKICSDPPSWIVQIAGARLELETDDLLQQQRFARKCVEKINMVPATLKAAKWKDFVNSLLLNVREIEAPQDSGDRGLFMFHLEQFCTQRSAAHVRDELLLGKPFHDEGRTFFRSSDLKQYLEQQRFYGLKGHQIYAVLRSTVPNIAHHQYHIHGKCVTAWSVPEFNQDPEQDTAPLPQESF